MTAKLVVLLAVAATLASAVPLSPNPKVDLDASYTTPQLIRKYGYPAEVHSVTTEDGYILAMHRIPYSPSSPAAPDKPIVFLQHGLMTSSGDWVIMGPEKGFAYMLADLGYDVWMGNSRGNRYSRNHVSLDPDVQNGTFWNFSWHEEGMYDMPAEIDHMLATTGHSNLFYVGHSQGTTQFYVLTSEKPEYNAKIRAQFSFAPVAYMSHAENPLLQFIINSNDTTELESLLGVHEFLPHSNLFTILGQTFCTDNSASQIICENILFLICGYDSEQLNSTMIPVIMGHVPAGASTKSLLHYAQLLANDGFRKYDYGLEGNLAAYGTEEPPSYDLSKITAPVSLHYSSNDWLAATLDVDHLHEQLPNPVGKFLVPLPAFNHLDFLWAIDVKTLLYNDVTELMASL